jgi:uroporphyrinogen-III synthase
MIVNEKREIKRQKKKEKILNAAAELFSHKNYHEVMMEDVAKLTDMAKGTVYNYFVSKEELYFSIMHSRLDNLITSLKEKIKSEKNSIDSLHSFVTHLYMFMMKYQNFFMMYQRESLKRENDLQTELLVLEDQLKGTIRSIISSGIKEQVFRVVDKDFVISLILGSIFGSVQRGVERNIIEEKRKAEREKLFDFILHGLYAGFTEITELPLKGKTIVITRTVEQSRESATILSNLGANVIVFPTLEIIPPSSWDDFDEIVSKPNKIDFIIFTSAHAVQMYINRCEELGAELNFNQTKVVSVGSKTSSICKLYNIPVHIVPLKFSAEGVVNALSKYNLKNKTVFIPRSVIAREELPRGLKELGAIIKPAPVYNVSIPTAKNIKPGIDELKTSSPDLFIFTSPSTFENFLIINKINSATEYFEKFDVAAIGPTTKSAIEKEKVKVNIMPDEFTIEGLIEKIIQHYRNIKEKY